MTQQFHFWEYAHHNWGLRSNKRLKFVKDSFICNSPKLGETQMSINSRLGKLIVIYSSNVILQNEEEEQTTNIYSNMVKQAN